MYIWLNYKPDDFIFIKADDPNYNGPLTSGMQIYVKVVGQDQYLYLSTTSYVKTDSQTDANVGKFMFDSPNSSIIKTGDSIYFHCIYKGTDYSIGKYYYTPATPSYYILAAGNNVLYTPVQIYDPTDSSI